MTPEKLFIGNSITIYGRTYKITEFADTSTKENYHSRKEKTLIIVKPDAMAHCGKIISEIQNYGFQLTRVLMLKFDDDMVRAFFDPRGQKKDFLELSSLMTSDNSLAIEVTGENAI